MEDQISIQLARFEQWLDSQAKNDNWNFKLYTLPFTNGMVKQAQWRANNFDSTNKEESITFLHSAILLYGPDADRKFLIRHVISPTDNKNRDFFINNPLYDPSSQKTSITAHSLNGLTPNPRNNVAGMLEQERRHNKEVQELNNRITSLEHQKDMDELRDEIAAIRHDNRNTMDKVTGFAESSLGQSVIGAILAKLNAPIDMAAINNQVGAHQNPQSQQESAIPKSDNNTQEQQSSNTHEAATEIDKINMAISKLEKVFPKEVAAALLDLSIFCETNPAQAQNLRNLAKTAKNGQ